jgi:ankyrin repeat protein
LVIAGVPIEQPDPSTSNTPLLTALYHKQFELAQDLINMGADVNARSTKNETPLHLSVRNDQEQLVKKLIMNGAFALIVD